MIPKTLFFGAIPKHFFFHYHRHKMVKLGYPKRKNKEKKKGKWVLSIHLVDFRRKFWNYYKSKQYIKKENIVSYTSSSWRVKEKMVSQGKCMFFHEEGLGTQSQLSIINFKNFLCTIKRKGGSWFSNLYYWIARYFLWSLEVDIFNTLFNAILHFHLNFHIKFYSQIETIMKQILGLFENYF